MLAIVAVAEVSDSDPANDPAALARHRKMMSRGAYLAARCVDQLIAALPAPRPTGVGYFLGVGASGGSLDDVRALLDASIVDGEFSLARFGDRGLAACNPLLAFQLMNNFTLCHGAILAGLDGPNSALFSRGAGTTAALIEAAHAVREGDCTLAIAGGADSARHPVTAAEMARAGLPASSCEGAAMIALAPPTDRAVAHLAGCAIACGEGRPVGDTLDDAVARAAIEMTAIDRVVLAPASLAVGEAMRGWLTARAPKTVDVIDLYGRGGDALAAAHALAWVEAVRSVREDRAHTVVTLGIGSDGDAGVAMIRRGARA